MATKLFLFLFVIFQFIRNVSSAFQYTKQTVNHGKTIGGLFMQKEYHECKSNNSGFKPLQVSLAVSIKNVSVWKHKDVIKLCKLKNQNDTFLQCIVDKMSHSYGIVMDKCMRTRRNRIELLLEWFMNSTVKAGIKLKYVQEKYLSIYVHDLSEIEDNIRLNHTAQLLELLLSDDKKDIINLLMDMSMYNNSNIIYNELISLLGFDLGIAEQLNTDNVAELVNYIIRSRQCLPMDVYRKAIEMIYSSTKSKKLKFVKKMEKLYDEIYRMDVNSSMDVIVQKMYPLLNTAQVDFPNFWNQFRQYIIKSFQKVISERLAASFLKVGLPLTLDIVNTYICRSRVCGHDLHVICLGFNGQYDQIIEGLVKFIDISMVKTRRLALARAILKEVKHVIPMNKSQSHREKIPVWK
eukprot:127020_1